MEAKVKLSVLGFSFNQSQSGTYGLVLAEENGLRRLMIVVGTPEAQSIAFKLHDSQPPRPLTHDLFQSLLYGFEIELKEVLIYKYEEGVFFSRLFFKQGADPVVTIESRTSDAIAIAIRTNSPIYTTESIMQELAVVFSESEAVEPDDMSKVSKINDERADASNYSLFSEGELELMLREAIEGEDYELASVLRDELQKKRNL